MGRRVGSLRHDRAVRDPGRELCEPRRPWPGLCQPHSQSAQIVLVYSWRSTACSRGDVGQAGGECLGFLTSPELGSGAAPSNDAAAPASCDGLRWPAVPFPALRRFSVRAPLGAVAGRCPVRWRRHTVGAMSIVPNSIRVCVGGRVWQKQRGSLVRCAIAFTPAPSPGRQPLRGGSVDRLLKRAVGDAEGEVQVPHPVVGEAQRDHFRSFRPVRLSQVADVQRAQPEALDGHPLRRTRPPPPSPITLTCLQLWLP